MADRESLFPVDNDGGKKVPRITIFNSQKIDAFFARRRHNFLARAPPAIDVTKNEIALVAASAATCCFFSISVFLIKCPRASWLFCWKNNGNRDASPLFRVTNTLAVAARGCSGREIKKSACNIELVDF